MTAFIVIHAVFLFVVGSIGSEEITITFNQDKEVETDNNQFLLNQSSSNVLFGMFLFMGDINLEKGRKSNANPIFRSELVGWVVPKSQVLISIFLTELLVEVM